MNRRTTILALGIWAAAALFGCRSNETTPTPGGIERTTTPIQLGFSGISTDNTAAAAASRAVGTVLTDPSQITSEDIMLYGVCEDFNSGLCAWTKADRLIDTTHARLVYDAAKNDYKFTYAATQAYYPAAGFLNVYSIYPSNGSYVRILDDGGATAPKAVVTLGDRFANQYDVLHGYTEQLTVAQAQQAAVSFNHALAQLRIKIYRDAEVSNHPTLTKVVVRGVSKATMASIERAAFTNSTDPADSLDFIAFEGSMPLEATSAATAHAINAATPLMLLPGMASIDRIVVTVDGNTFTTYVPKTWSLTQGKINTLTLTLRKMEVRTEAPWVVTQWGVGENVNEGIENNGKMIRISAQMLDASGTTKAAYLGTAPAKADITLLGFTHKGVAIESVASGVFTTALFNSGSLNDNPLCLEGLVLYDAGNNVLFNGRLGGGKLLSGATVYIDEANGGRLKRNSSAGTAVDLTMTFGGFGEGTSTSPYEVHSVFHLRQIDNLLGPKTGTAALNGTNGNGAYFKQIDHIDFGGAAFRGIGAVAGTTDNAFCGVYDGNFKELRNVNIVGAGGHVGLFAAIQRKGTIAPSGLVANVVITGGTVTGSNTAGTFVGAITGQLLAGATVWRCSNRSNVVAGGANNGGAGGVIGQLNTSGRVTRCANFGSVSGSNSMLGGVVGRTSSNGAGSRIDSCYNAGAVACTFAGTPANYGVGGVVGYLLPSNNAFVFTANYNHGSVTSTATGTAVGALIGYLGGASATAVWGPSYYLTGGLVPIGVDNASKTSTMVGKDTSNDPATGMKGSGTITGLGSFFKADYASSPINGGFPILDWQ